MKNISKAIIIMMAICSLLFLSACGSGDQEKTDEEIDQIYTSAAETVAFQLTESASQITPTLTNTVVETATSTVAPPTQQSQPQQQTPSVTKMLATSTFTNAVVLDKGELIAQNPEDYTEVAGGAEFTVTWQVKNTGDTIWTTDYQIRHYSGSRIGTGLPNSYAFPSEVKPGETVSLTVKMNSGSESGDITSTWVLTNDDGVNFYPVYVVIKISSKTVTPTITATTGASESATPTITLTP